MHNPFAIAVHWPDDPRRYLVHLQRPYFTAAIFETASAAWLAVSWAPRSDLDAASRANVFRAAADFCRTHLDFADVPIEFVEQRHGYPLPRFLMAQAAGAAGLFIVEPEHTTPLVEVRDSDPARSRTPKKSHRFDVITEWRLEQMRAYYQQFLERQHKVNASSPLKSGALAPEKK
jgi:hypothetical protein